MTKVARGGVYMASKAIHGRRWCALRATGFPVCSTWIDESDVGDTSDWADLWTRSIREASEARVVIVYNEPGERMKGALVEVGAALSRGVPVLWVGSDCDPEGKEYTVIRHPLVTRMDSLAAARYAAA